MHDSVYFTRQVCRPVTLFHYALNAGADVARPW